MDEILADDFVLVTDRGASLTKADLIKEAQEKRTIYEHQEVEEGTQKVRIWRDTAVVTALLRAKGTRDQNPFDYEVWLSQTYVRTPTGWRYVFGGKLRNRKQNSFQSSSFFLLTSIRTKVRSPKPGYASAFCSNGLGSS